MFWKSYCNIFHYYKTFMGAGKMAFRGADRTFVSNCCSYKIVVCRNEDKTRLYNFFTGMGDGINVTASENTDAAKMLAHCSRQICKMQFPINYPFKSNTNMH